MKIKKEYGLEVFKVLNESLNTLTALDRIYDEINHNILVVFVEETNPSFQEIGDMFDYANLMCWFYEELKHNFFNKYVEGGYQEPLYYLRDVVTNQYMYTNKEVYRWLSDGNSNPLWKLVADSKQEWLEINPAYEKMLVEVEE